MKEFEITCFHPERPKVTLLVGVPARDVEEAFGKVEAMGFVVVCW